MNQKKKPPHSRLCKKQVYIFRKQGVNERLYIPLKTTQKRNSPVQFDL